MDVKNAFLNNDLLEKVYKHPPLDYTHCHNQVCCLHRALYGLKQAHQFWFAKLSVVVAQQGFTPNAYDSTPFIRQTSTCFTIILFYIDDKIIVDYDIVGICALQQFLSQHF